MTDPVFRTAPYLSTLRTRILALTEEGGIIPAASNFYPTGAASRAIRVISHGMAGASPSRRR